VCIVLDKQYLSGCPSLSIQDVRVNNGYDLLPRGEAVVQIGMRATCPVVSGEKFTPKENAGYSACGRPAGGDLYERVMCLAQGHRETECVISTKV
jgi:hypothetical protein